MPLQAAPQVVSAPTAPSPSLLPIPPYRVRAFAVGVAQRLREAKTNGISEAQMLATIRTERLALANALGQQSFRDAFANAYEQAHNTVMAAATVLPADARRATDEIIDNRINDAKWLAQLVMQPDFIAKARATTEVKSTPYQLPREKITEMVARFAADGSSYGLDARVHNQQSMEGHRIGHLVLAQVYADKGPLQAVLEQNLAQQMGGDTVAAKRLADDWLEARRQPAIATAHTLGSNGEVYQQVMQRSDMLRHVPATQFAAKPSHSTTAAFPLALQSTTALSPQTVEHNKTRQQKAEDLIYTLNHAITCLSITDLLVMPAVNGVLGTMFGKSAPQFGCGGHGHGHGHHAVHGPACDHTHHNHSPWDELKAPFRNVRNWFRSDEPWSEKFKVIGKNSKNWLISEAAGDIGAVVPTLVMQRFAPGVMDTMRRGLESVFGGSFQRGSKKAAEKWADKNGLEHDSIECINRAQELYEYEVRHLPQMAVWTAASIGISYGVMRHLSPAMTLPEFARTKIVGAGVTAGLVVGARAFSPNAAHSWDQKVSEHIIVPTTKILGKPFGVKDEDVDRAVERHRDDAPVLKGRVQEAPLQQLAS